MLITLVTAAASVSTPSPSRRRHGRPSSTPPSTFCHQLPSPRRQRCTTTTATGFIPEPPLLRNHHQAVRLPSSSSPLPSSSTTTVSAIIFTPPLPSSPSVPPHCHRLRQSSTSVISVIATPPALPLLGHHLQRRGHCHHTQRLQLAATIVTNSHHCRQRPCCRVKPSRLQPAIVIANNCSSASHHQQLHNAHYIELVATPPGAATGQRLQEQSSSLP